MNRFKTLGAALALLSACSFAAPVSAIGLTLVPEAGQIGQGSTLRVDLVADGLGDHAAPSLAAFDVDVSYDPAVFSFEGGSFGTALGDPAQGEAFADATPGPGTVNLSETSLLEASAANCAFCLPPYLEDLQAGSIVLASLYFTGHAPGTGAFGLSVNALGDAAGESLAPILAPGPHVEVAPVPIPAALWLFGGALAGLLGLARRGGGDSAA